MASNTDVSNSTTLSSQFLEKIKPLDIPRLAVGIIALIDLLIAYFVTMELEERELLKRFGEQYEKYRMKVPKFFPKIG